MAIFNDLEQALGGPVDPKENRFLEQTSGGTSFPSGTENRNASPSRAQMTRQRTRQGENVQERRVLLGEEDAKEPRMLRESEKRQRKPKITEPQGKGVKPLQQELRKYDKPSLRKTLTTIQGQSSDAKVFGSNLTVGEARKVIRDELKRRQ